MVLKTLESEELPPRQELAKFMGNVTADFFKDPVVAIKNGLEREKKARALYKDITGQDADTHLKGTAKLIKDKVKKLAKDPETAVGVAGLAGSIAGGAVAGPGGAIAGDLVGALTVRKIIEVNQAFREQRQSTEKESSVSRIERLKAITGRTISAMKQPKAQQEIEQNLVGDASGWAIGNGAAAALNAASIGIPAGGAVAAMATVSTIVSPIAKGAHDRVRQGMSAAEATRESIREYMISGDRREAEWRQNFSQHIRNIKARGEQLGLTQTSLEANNGNREQRRRTG